MSGETRTNPSSTKRPGDRRTPRPMIALRPTMPDCVRTSQARVGRRSGRATRGLTARRSEPKRQPRWTCLRTASTGRGRDGSRTERDVVRRAGRLEESVGQNVASAFWAWLLRKRPSLPPLGTVRPAERSRSADRSRGCPYLITGAQSQVRDKKNGDSRAISSRSAGTRAGFGLRRAERGDRGTLRSLDPWSCCAEPCQPLLGRHEVESNDDCTAGPRS